MNSASEKKAIASAIVVAADRALLVRRNTREGTLLWAFPGGEIESAESPETAAKRECIEELGLEVTPLEVIAERVHPATGRSMVYVACSTDGPEAARVLDEDELAELRWVTLAELDELTGGTVYAPVRAYVATYLAE